MYVPNIYCRYMYEQVYTCMLQPNLSFLFGILQATKQFVTKFIFLCSRLMLTNLRHGNFSKKKNIYHNINVGYPQWGIQTFVGYRFYKKKCGETGTDKGSYKKIT